jgi:hypothetical protein
MKCAPAACVQHRPATGAQDNPVALRQLFDHRSLPSTERCFTFDFKNSRNAHASPLLELVIGIDEGQSNALGKQLAYGRLARSHQSDQKYFLNAHVNSLLAKKNAATAAFS